MKNMYLVLGLVFGLSLGVTAADDKTIPGGIVDSVERKEKVDVKDQQRLVANADACLIEGKADVIEGDFPPIEQVPAAGNIFVVVKVHLTSVKKMVPSISRYDYVLQSDDDTQTIFECKGISAKSRNVVFETRPCPPVYGEDLDVFLLFEVPEKIKEFVFKLRPVEGQPELPVNEVKVNLNAEE